MLCDGVALAERMSALALGEEDGGGSTPDPIFTTLALGEEDGGLMTTLALGEEDGGAF